MTVPQMVAALDGNDRADALAALGPENAAPDEKRTALGHFAAEMRCQGEARQRRMSNLSTRADWTELHCRVANVYPKLPFVETRFRQYQTANERSWDVIVEIIDAMKTASWQSRCLLCHILAGGPVQAIREILRDRLAHDSSEMVRSAAADSLGKCGKTSDQARLIGMLQTLPTWVSTVPDPTADIETRWSGARRRIDIGPPMDIRAGIVSGLGLAQVAEAVDTLIGLLGDQSMLCKMATIHALRQIGDPRAIAALTKLRAKTDDPIAQREKVQQTIDDAVTYLNGADA